MGDTNKDWVWQTFGHPFGDVTLLARALTPTTGLVERVQARTHQPYDRRHLLPGEDDNTRLAFLGDAVIELAVREHLYRTSDALPGGLTEAKQYIVDNPTLGKTALNAGLGARLDLGVGGGKEDLRENANTLATALEALVGAVYQDSRDPHHTFEFVLELLHRYAPDRCREQLGLKAPPGGLTGR